MRGVFLVIMVILKMVSSLIVSFVFVLTVVFVYSCITGTSCVLIVRRGMVVRVIFFYSNIYGLIVIFLKVVKVFMVFFLSSCLNVKFWLEEF